MYAHSVVTAELQKRLGHRQSLTPIQDGSRGSQRAFPGYLKECSGIRIPWGGAGAVVRVVGPTIQRLGLSNDT